MPPSVADQSDDQQSWITREFLEEVLHREADTSGATVVGKDVELAVAKGDNYLSVLYRVRVLFKQAGSDEVLTRHLIVKILPEGDFLQKFVNEIGLFKRELQVYNVALPAMYRLQKTPGSAPLSARSFCTSRPDTLVLEDLRPQGFVMSDRRKRLDLPHSRLVVRSLARLHGISAVLIHQQPTLLADFVDKFYCADNRENIDKTMCKQMASVANILESWQGYERFASKFRHMTPTLIDRLIEVTKPIEGEFKVLLHGDCWINNMLFKYSSTGELEDIRFVDFQIARVGSPALDLHYFMYTNLQTEVLEQHADQLVSDYHETMCTIVREMDPEVRVPTLRQFQDEMRRTIFFGFFASQMLLAPVVGDAKDSPELSELKEDDHGEVNAFEKIHQSSSFREALEPLLITFEKVGVFD